MPTEIEIMMDPEKHGYEVCENCNGYGSSLKEDSDRCSKCGGRGLVKKSKVSLELINMLAAPCIEAEGK